MPQLNSLANSRNQHRLFLAFLVAVTSGCSRAPKPIRPPSIDANDAASRAIQICDQNGDGRLSGNELRAAPGLRAALKTFDANGDQAIIADEIVQRINAWRDSQVGLIAIRCDVVLDGGPLEGATVTYEPESFLGEEIQTAVGTTNQFGTAYMSIPKENRPAPDAPGGVQFGLYRVRVSKQAGGRETVPARYNESTELGQEISYEDPGVASGIIYELTSR